MLFNAKAQRRKDAKERNSKIVGFPEGTGYEKSLTLSAPIKTSSIINAISLAFIRWKAALMSKQRLQSARELIQQKKYVEARRILKGVDDPTAQKWLAKLDEIAPEKRSSTAFQRWLLVVVLVMIGAIVIVNALQNRDDGLVAVASAVVPFPTEANEITQPTVSQTSVTTAIDTPAPIVTNNPTTIIDTATLNRSTVQAARPLEDELTSQFEEIEGVNLIRMVSTLPTQPEGYIVYTEADTEIGYETQVTAENFLTIAQENLTVAEFSVILTDGEGGAVDFMWTERNGWNVTPLSVSGF